MLYYKYFYAIAGYLFVNAGVLFMNREIAIEEVVITDSFAVTNGDMKPALQPIGAACGLGCGGVGCAGGGIGAACGVLC